jgi:ABC-type polysaccharide/polyol phosphate transport system ATPase subunit
MTKENAIEIENLTKYFFVGGTGYAGIKGQLGALLKGIKQEKKQILALNNISLTIPQGQTVALIGRNGAGKSTILSLLANVIKPDSGKITFPASSDPTHPRIAPLLEVGAGFHLDLTGRQNVFFNGAILGLSKAEMQKRYDEIITFADFQDTRYIDAPVRTYSSGMKVRLGFAVAAHTDPEILLMDETFAVGDEAFQEKCYAKIGEFQKAGKTLLFVSHDMEAVKRVADRALWLHDAHIAEDGTVEQVIDAYHAALHI